MLQLRANVRSALSDAKSLLHPVQESGHSIVEQQTLYFRRYVASENREFASECLLLTQENLRHRDPQGVQMICLAHGQSGELYVDSL